MPDTWNYFLTACGPLSTTTVRLYMITFNYPNSWTGLSLMNTLWTDIPEPPMRIGPKSILARRRLQRQLLRRLSISKPVFKASEKSFFVFYSQTKKVSELLASYWGRHRVDYRAGSHCHRRGSSLRSSFGMLALRQSILESQIPVLSVRNFFSRRFLFG